MPPPNAADLLFQAIYRQLRALMPEPAFVLWGGCAPTWYLSIYEETFWLMIWDDTTVMISCDSSDTASKMLYREDTEDLKLADPQLCEKLVEFIHAHLDPV